MQWRMDDISKGFLEQKKEVLNRVTSETPEDHIEGLVHIDRPEDNSEYSFYTLLSFKECLCCDRVLLL